MSAPQMHDGAHHAAVHPTGVWLTDREPGELLGVRRVVVHVLHSEPIVVAETTSRQEAVVLAERVVEAIDQAAARGEWPELEDRLVRPEAIVSVDVELAE